MSAPPGASGVANLFRSPLHSPIAPGDLLLVLSDRLSPAAAPFLVSLSRGETDPDSFPSLGRWGGVGWGRV